MRIAIIGAGPGGLCMAKRLLDLGHRDFVILERSDAVGGTWQRNRYPGCECDVESALYSFSFAPKPDWSKPYATQPEILAYMQGVAERFGLLPFIRFGAGVRRADWDEASAQWTLTLESGARERAEIVVSAIGMFNALVRPAIEGLDRFAGTLFHSAEWPRDHDLAGERVAVIGSAASAVQLVPEIRKVARQVHLFQRTANWILPKEDVPYTAEQLEHFRRSPEAVAARRASVQAFLDEFITFANAKQIESARQAAIRNLEQVKDPVLREKLRPTHEYGCKRGLLSNDYYPAFNEPNLELVTEPIARLDAHAVVTADGRAREVDTVILATGFDATRFLSAIEVVGRGGRSIEDAWRSGAEAYLGITTSGFPNLFMLYGPNTNNGSILAMIESQVEHVLGHVQRFEREGLAWTDVRPEAMAAFNDEIQHGIDAIGVWQSGCNGYYKSASGRIVTQWPFTMAEFQRRTARIDPAAFEVAVRA
ncbi:MAG: NAD(P)/FAD-dependent oxidoreductase [Myxococcota bacterium]